MNRAERDSLAKWSAFADTIELRDAIVRELGVRERLKADRAPDLSGVIDRLTVLVAAWCRRHSGMGLIHRTTMATVDRAGELWITELGAVRARVKVEKGEAVEVSAEAEAAIAGLAAERLASYRSRADRLIAAARRLIGRGEELSSAGLSMEMGAGFSPADVAALVKRMRSYGDWPRELGSLAKKRRAPNAKLMAGVSTWREPRPEPPPPPEDELPADQVAWANLGPEFPAYEGTADGRIRSAGTGRIKVPTAGMNHVTVKNADGRTTSVTRVKVARIASAALGVEPTGLGLDGRTRRRLRREAEEAARPPKRRGRPKLEHIDFNG